GAGGTSSRAGGAEKSSDQAINLPDIKAPKQPSLSFPADISQSLRGRNEPAGTLTVLPKITTIETVEVTGERGGLHSRGQDLVSDYPSQGKAMNTDHGIPPQTTIEQKEQISEKIAPESQGFTERDKFYTIGNESGRYATVEWKDHYKNHELQGGGL